jgi:hypothetical protein
VGERKRPRDLAGAARQGGEASALEFMEVIGVERGNSAAAGALESADIFMSHEVELLGPDVGERKRPRDLAGAARQGGEARGEERPDVVGQPRPVAPRLWLRLPAERLRPSPVVASALPRPVRMSALSSAPAAAELPRSTPMTSMNSSAEDNC